MNKNLYTLSLSYKKDSITGDFVNLFFEKYVKFKPTDIRIKDFYDFSLLRLKKVFNQEIVDNFSVFDDFNCRFSVTKTVGGEVGSHQILNLSQSLDLMPPKEDINNLCQAKNFIVGYFYNELFDVLQSATTAEEYLGAGFDEAFIVSLPTTTNERGNLIADTTNNPGRRVIVDELYIQVAWRMWFGNLFFNFIPKEKILSFKGAYQIEELENGAVFVQLHENPSLAQENISVYADFRQHLEFDKLEKQLST
jgi:hypothetical protein